jgi:hypothetical protein
MRLALAAVAAVIFSGCANVSPVPQQLVGLYTADERLSQRRAEQLDPDNFFECEWEAPTGSHLYQETCRTLRKKARDRQHAQALIQEWQMQTIREEQSLSRLAAQRAATQGGGGK